MPKASVVVPAWNARATLSETLASLTAQSFRDAEIIVVDDGSTDDTAAIAERFGTDPRVRLIRQGNRGLAGARNSGIAAARGEYIGLCDADDLWEPDKLAQHVHHLDTAPQVGISYSGSRLIDASGRRTRHAQRPRLRRITLPHVFKRNPVGNGSAAVLRRAALEAVAYRPADETARDWYFDENFRQSEDIEFWLRLALTTDWDFEGIPGLLTAYRIGAGGLSTDTGRQYAAWCRMVDKLRPLNPPFFARHEAAARAYQLRYLARRAISDMEPARATALLGQALASSWRPLFEEPVRTLSTLAALPVLHLFPTALLRKLSGIAAAGQRARD